MRVRFCAAEAKRLDAVEPHAHAGVPADHVGDGERALHHRADLVALLDVLPPAGFGAARPLRRRTAPRSRRSRRRCTDASSTASYFLRSRAFSRSVRTIRRYWPDEQRAGRRRGTPARSTRGSPARRTRSACRARRRARCGETSGAAGTAAPTTRVRWRRRTRARRASGSPFIRSRCSAATSVTSSSPISVSPPTSTGDAIGILPPGLGAVRRVAPQRVVVAVGDRDVAEGVVRRLRVERRHRVRLGDADARAQTGRRLRR